MVRKYEEELEIKLKLGKLLGSKTLLLYDLINLLDKYGLTEEKIDCWNILDKEKPFDIDIMYAIADCYAQLGDTDNVERCYNKIREVTHEHDSHLWNKLGRLLLVSNNNKKINKGIMYLEKAFEINPDDLDALFHLIKACYELGYHDKQKKYSEIYLGIDPHDELVKNLLLDSMEKEKD